ncbi:XRE family transcriptional regulator [Petrocella atlantisensis]|uniref:XRE family transcriptional regulator n=1 Tax=Petrocella atlantisensis TaxID=2173034 RepID=A0A3P7RWP9_9FIRM|nr:helix-turn-helix transcriptional regulator [Petrocella atlantisensis]MCF8020310.1 helix-turn-helix domain-containing protein [Vallitaleaceae bacterium]VDN47102.1 XRE family transcriptional regulator [Petrocella atlantisensis]
MELNEKLQELRKQKELTQEELAEKLFVSRTAISKWESGRGYPNIDSLKAIAEFFDVTIDELLSSKELLSLAQKDSAIKIQQVRDLVFGLLDLSFLLLIFIPLFGQPEGDFIRQVSLIAIEYIPIYIEVIYYTIILGITVFGTLLLTLQNWDNGIWIKNKSKISVLLSILSVMIFMATLQPYIATLSFILLLIKASLLFKGQ